MSDTKPTLPWGLWAIWTLIALAILVALASEESATNLPPLQWASLAIALAPLIGAQRALGSPRAAYRTRAWPAHTRYPLPCTAGGITALYLLSALLAGHFDPYATVIFGFGAFATLGTLKQIEKGKSGLTWADAARRLEPPHANVHFLGRHPRQLDGAGLVANVPRWRCQFWCAGL